MAVKPIYAAGLDAGSRQTRLVVCVLENSRMRFVGASAVESQGWVKGRIADQQAVAESMTAALREVEAAPRARSNRSLWAWAAPPCAAPTAAACWNWATCSEIEQRDVNRVVERASRVQLHGRPHGAAAVPAGFRGGRPSRASRPAQDAGRRAWKSTSTWSPLPMQEHNALVGAVNQAHLAVEETVFEGLAACYAAVLPENRREGIAVVDIGAQSTELVVYYGDAMHLASTVRICGDHFTRDLAQGLCLSFEDAELVKLEFGCALSEELSRECAGGSAHAGESRAARSFAPLRQPDSGSARRGAVPLRARANWRAWAWNAR